jgi:hypothetical protein
MKKWSVHIDPSDYSVGSVYEIKDKVERTDVSRFTDFLKFPENTTVTLSGVMVMEVEAENEVEAGHEAVKQVLIKRVKDLEHIQKRERAWNKTREDNKDVTIKRLLGNIDSFMDIIRGGELEVYDTGRRIYATWYHREPKRELRTELPSGILFDQLVNTIKDSVNNPYDEECY